MRGLAVRIPAPAPKPSKFRYIHENLCNGGPMGEVIDATSGFGGFSGGFSLISGVVSLVALGLYALLQGDTNNNDDDDSSPGGGLMQPVA
jgi:hypothetical protein